MATDKNHPEYRDGFIDAFDGIERPADCTPEYGDGWNAALRVKALFRENGFVQEPDGSMSITLPINP